MPALFFRFAIFVCLLANFSQASAQSIPPWPATWQKTLTDDPETNYPLKKYSVQPDGEVAQFYHRMVLLGVMLSCKSVVVNLNIWRRYRKTVNPAGFDPKVKEEALFLVRSRFTQMDTRDLAHLCAGALTLFGDNGTLLPKVAKPSGRSNGGKYDPSRPYINIDFKRLLRVMELR